MSSWTKSSNSVLRRSSLMVLLKPCFTSMGCKAAVFHSCTCDRGDLDHPTDVVYKRKKNSRTKEFPRPTPKSATDSNLEGWVCSFWDEFSDNTSVWPNFCGRRWSYCHAGSHLTSIKKISSYLHNCGEPKSSNDNESTYPGYQKILSRAFESFRE